MDYSNLLFACSAALFAGGLNSIAGGGTFITLPALLSAGMSPVMANTTSASVMFPGYLGSVLGFRDVLSSVSRKYLFILIVLSILFSSVGATLLISSTDKFFMQVIPFLILIATLLFATNVVNQNNILKSQKPFLSKVLLGFVSSYGGYFNGGLGIALLSALSFEKKYSLRELSAIKSLLSFVITVVSVMVFISNQFVVWSYALYMIIFSVIGGYIGARLTQLVNENFIKYFVIFVGLSLSAGLFYLEYLI